MSKIQTYEIKVDDETKLEITQLGAGQPSALLISGVHGHEKTGPELLCRLSDRLASMRIHGSVSLLPIANPKASQANARYHPDDGHDLNRCFLGGVAPEDSPSGRLVAAIQQLIDQPYQVVVDIHGFPQQLTPIVGVFLREGESSLQQQSDQLLQTFNPEVIWELDVQTAEPKKAGSACSYALQKRRIPAFGLELADPKYFLEAQWSQIIRGLLKVLGKVGCLDLSLTRVGRRIPRFGQREIYRAPAKGIFIPRKLPLRSVAKGEVVGELIQEGDRLEFPAKHAGFVLTVAPQGQVKAKQKMFATAVPVFT